MERIQIQVNGVVQGVGFRPFVHKLTNVYNLSGWIKNTNSGVTIDVEGESANINFFIRDLIEKAPQLAIIEEVITTVQQDFVHYIGFEILKSTNDSGCNTLISPDIGICEDCLAEMQDTKDKRYRYPFINCTNCGPRFTIVKNIPYDRCSTTMEHFPMCEACAEEYADIENRRYHAQPTCCPDCGPRLQFYDNAGDSIDGDPIELAKQYLKSGKIVAVKGLGGMHLACLTDEKTVKTLRQRKHREEKPFAIMCKDKETAAKYCCISKEELTKLESFRRPIVLLQKHGEAMSHISENNYIGIMLPYTPIHYLLFEDGIDALIMTSANISDLPIIYKNDEAVANLKGIADGFLVHNRDIHIPCDDSLLWVRGEKEYFVRRSRGYAPAPISLNKDVSGILACGAEQKASFGLGKGHYYFQSQHIGDMKNAETFDNYKSQIEHFCKIFDIKPKKIACDLHPNYLSTEYAEEYSKREGLSSIFVQHHHAHMAACMADNNLSCDCIGIIWDGVGYGTDGTAWGGEILVGGYNDFKRIASIRPIRLPGGDKAVKEIYRIGYSILRDSGLHGKISFGDYDCTGLDNMLKADINCPKTSGMGRLFDGVCAILGIRYTATYEGQGASLLESVAVADCEENYTVAFEHADDILLFDYRPMIKEIVQDIKEKVTTEIIAARFMNTLTEAAVQQCIETRKSTGISDVVLSGGVFQNMYLLERLPMRLKQESFHPYKHCRVSTNDEGIPLGQMMIAASKKDAE